MILSQVGILASGVLQALLSHNFIGSTVNSDLGTVSNPDTGTLTISQNNRIIFTRTTDTAVSNQNNRWTSVSTFEKGSVISCVLNRDSGYTNSIFRFAWEFGSNTIVVQNSSTSPGTMRLIIQKDAGANEYDFESGISTSNRVKITYTTQNVISFWYWNVDTWTQIGTSQTLDLGSSGTIVFSSNSALADAAGHRFSFGQIRVTDRDYSAKVPEKFLFFDVLNDVPDRYVGNPVLTNDGTYTNTCPAGIITDPQDPARFLFYRGEFLGYITVGARISLFSGNLSDPYTITTENAVVLQGSESYDINGCRFGCVLRHGAKIYYYYVGIDASYDWRICLATSTDGRTFTKQGVVLDFNNVDEKSVSDPSIYIEDGTWYMIYTGWDGLTSPANNNPGESKIGIKLATSNDGITWTKTETTLVPLGSAGSYDDNNVEGGQLLKYGSTWTILYNANDGAEWSIGIAYREEINSQFIKKTTRFFQKAATGWDSHHVAVPFIHDFDGQQVMYYQAGTSPNPDEIDDIGAADINI
jgi:predicted GH43/DUF377 family glycosyl hydrolase